MASNSSIARKAHSKAEADFTTWLMMAKLGSFDDLPSNAQSFLTNYRARLDMMSEAESTALAVREVYGAYYSEMGGVGAAPKDSTPTTGHKVVQFQRRPKPQPGQSAARHSTRPMIRKSLPALLIFASMVALIVTRQRPRMAASPGLCERHEREDKTAFAPERIHFKLIVISDLGRAETLQKKCWQRNA